MNRLFFGAQRTLQRIHAKEHAAWARTFAPAWMPVGAFHFWGSGFKPAATLTWPPMWLREGGGRIHPAAHIRPQLSYTLPVVVTRVEYA